MTAVLLFCIAEEAKPCISKILDSNMEKGKQPYYPFYLVESHTCSSDSTGFKRELKNDETFETDFIGASVEECQKWALENQFQVTFIEQDIIAIVDARSAIDETLSVQWYEELGPPSDPEEITYYEPEANRWYDFRIKYEKANTVIAHLANGSIPEVKENYFGHKEELTDGHGVFDVTKARRLVRGEESL
ncbi:hypothetical protein DPV78_012601 [Talaromyces pinophilus]|nr:hypothetical protein DPV78_012601 [Talaromyces pinophilus]